MGAQSRLPDNASNDWLGEIKALVIGDGHPSGFRGMFEMNMRSGFLFDVKTALLQCADNEPRFQVGQLGRHSRT